MVHFCDEFISVGVVYHLCDQMAFLHPFDS